MSASLVLFHCFLLALVSPTQSASSALLSRTVMSMADVPQVGPVIPGRSQSFVDVTWSSPVSSTLPMLISRAAR